MAQYTGKDADGPILVAVDGLVYNVAKARNLYGPGGEYAIMAGRDATLFLAKNSVEIDEIDEIGGFPKAADARLNLAEQGSLAAWKFVFDRKYDVVGRFAGNGPDAHHTAWNEKNEIARVADHTDTHQY